MAFKTLQNKLTLWAIAKLLMVAVDKLHYENVGAKLNAVMDHQLTKSKSDPLQKKMAYWLRQIASELET